MTVRVWLIGFVLLFIGVETLEWLFRLGGSDGYWVMLGGLGLAAASNAKHLPKLGDTQANADLSDSKQVADFQQVSAKTSNLEQPQRNAENAANQRTEDKNIDRSEDSISFRIRLPWR